MITPIIAEKLFVADQQGSEDFCGALVHACKDPCHRAVIGYAGRSLPSDHPEYLVARRGNELFLNLIDAPTPDLISKLAIDAALDFIHEQCEQGVPTCVHCNQGLSRAPGIALLYLVQQHYLSGDRYVAIPDFLALYPRFLPGQGMSQYILQHWSEYRGY